MPQTPASNSDRWQEALRRLPEARRVVVDVETSGLDWRRNVIVGWVLTFGPAPDDSYYLPVRHGGGGNILGHPGLTAVDSWDGSFHPIEADILKGLDRQDVLLQFHNGAFDLKFMARVGYSFQARHEDSIINAPLLNEHADAFSLEACARDAGVAAKKSDLIKDYLISRFPGEGLTPRNAMGHFWRLAGDDPVAVEYAEGDGTSTHQLIDWQDKQLALQELGTVHKVESDLIPVLARMSVKGIKVDEERLHWLRGHIKEQLDKLLEAFPPDFSSRSPSHVRKWCEDHGATDWPLTPKGAPSFNEAWLETHEPGKAIIRLRKLSNLRDSFVNPLIETHLWKGRVHTDFNQLRGDEYGTVTGRLSSSNPNLTQVPKRNKELGKLFRSVFIPDEGMIWGSADYRQCEPLLLAFYSRAKVLLDGFRAVPPVDPHAAVTRAINPNWESMTPEEFKAARETGKRTNQTIISAGGAKTLAAKYKVQNPEQVMRDYFAAMPEVRELQRKAARRFEQRGYLVSLIGRRVRLVDRSKSYTAINRILQTGNAEVIKTKMVQIDQYLASEGRPVDLLISIHDALESQFSEASRKVYEECLRIMTDFSPGQLIELDVPLGIDTGEGRSWAEATWGKE